MQEFQISVFFCQVPHGGNPHQVTSSSSSSFPFQTEEDAAGAESRIYEEVKTKEGKNIIIVFPNKKQKTRFFVLITERKKTDNLSPLLSFEPYSRVPKKGFFRPPAIVWVCGKRRRVAETFFIPTTFVPSFEGKGEGGGRSWTTIKHHSLFQLVFL